MISLVDLGEESIEHDEIMTTACERFDNIIVTDFNTIRAVFNFLKKKKLCRTTCIIL